MAFQCHLACWVWPKPWDWQWRDNMFVSCTGLFIGKGWGFWHTNVQGSNIQLVCGSKLSDHIYILQETTKHEWNILKNIDTSKHTCKHTRQLQCQLQLDWNVGRKCISSHQKPDESSHFFPLQFENGLFHFPAVRRKSFLWTLTYKNIGKEKERLIEREWERTTHLTIHWHESEPLKLTNTERKLQFCAFVSICMSKGNWEIVLQCQVLLAVFSLW